MVDFYTKRINGNIKRQFYTRRKYGYGRLLEAGHSTSSDSSDAIVDEGYFKKGSWFTLDRIEDLPPPLRLEALCLDDQNKGDCVWKCPFPQQKMFIPAEGFYTCNDSSQIRSKGDLPIDNCTCRCHVDYGLFALCGIGLGSGFGFLLTRNIKGTIAMGALWLGISLLIGKAAERKYP